MIKKSSILLCLSLIFLSNSFSQNEINYKLIDSLGRDFTNNLRLGNIEFLENSKPPKGSFTYKRMLEYKEALTEHADTIRIGSLVEPSINPSYCAFNLFAFRRTGKKSFEYYFAAIISIDISGDIYKIDKTYLFTEKGSLESWWSHILGFYESDARLKIPKELVFPVCPPPPFMKD